MTPYYSRTNQSKSSGFQNGVPRKKKSRPAYTRCPDYPSFAYDDDSNSNSLSPNGGRQRPMRRVSIDNDRMYGGDDEGPNSFFEKMLKPPASALEFDFLVSGIRDSNRRTRLLNRRSYTAREPFLQKNIQQPPCLQDLKAPSSPFVDVFWISIPFRILSFALSYYSFPYLIRFLDNYVTMKPEQLSGITDKFGPGVSILYGTFISLTLAILYQRQRDIQTDVAMEASLLALITRNLLRLFRCDPDLSVEAGQSCADQIRLLAKGSRGSELLAIMYSDPYARMLEIIEDREITLMEEKAGDLGGEGAAIGSCRQILEDLFKIRADRLSDESLALPPTHFLIMTILTLFILLGYAINVLPTVDVATGNPSNESAIIFGMLSTVYILFYNFAQDLNDPFSGLYQIRRSSTAAHLLQAKWLLVNNPLTKGQINFDEPDPNRGEEVLIRTPGIGDVLFARDEIYPDTNTNAPKVSKKKSAEV
eukprot:jgi/Psemu1/317516/estExt_fgenesh1_pm.C_140038